MENRQGQLVLHATAASDVFLKEAISASGYNVTIKNNATNAETYNNTVASLTTPLGLPSGTYTVTVKSEDFTTPAFSKPVYGASKSDVAITGGATTDLSLACKQTNAGVKVAYATEFKDFCTSKNYDYGVKITTGNATLDYGKKSTTLVSDIGYFLPGSVTVTVMMNGIETTKTITLAAQELVTVNVKLSPSSSSKLMLSVSKN